MGDLPNFKFDLEKAQGWSGAAGYLAVVEKMPHAGRFIVGAAG
jgi:hypothetical protein